MGCKKCGSSLTGLQTKFCSEHCCKLFLKAEYRKRNREKLRLYSRKYRSYYREPNSRNEMTELRYLLEKKCAKCGSRKQLTLNHIRPLNAGGKSVPENLETLCLKCNIIEYHKLVRTALLFYFENKKTDQ